MATIQIRDLAVQAIIGIHNGERAAKQALIVNVSLDYDAEKAAQSDDMAFAVDYQAIEQRVVKSVENSHFFLVERLAKEILAVVMEDIRVTGAVVTIDKSKALQHARSVAVTMSARRS